MSLPGNGIFVVQGEMAILVTAMRRGSRWGSHSNQDEEHDILMRAFQDLRDILNQVADLRLLDPNVFLGPFLEVIRSEKTTGSVTCLALSAINKFLCYGLIDPMHTSVPASVENIADAVTHARFVGTDHSSDGVVLMKILQVLRTLVLSPEGAMLTDESVCEIMLSCFRICFETRLSELLRRNAEQSLRDMTQLVFMRLPQFCNAAGEEGIVEVGGALSLRRRTHSARKNRESKGEANRLQVSENFKSAVLNPTMKTSNSGIDLSLTPAPNTKVVDMQGNITRTNLAIETSDQTYSSISSIEKCLEQSANSQSDPETGDTSLQTPPLQDQTKSPSKKHGRHSSMDLASSENIYITQLVEKCVNSSETITPSSSDMDLKEKVLEVECVIENKASQAEEDLPQTDVASNEQEKPDSLVGDSLDGQKNCHRMKIKNSPEVIDYKEEEVMEKDYINPRGVRFISQDEQDNLQPYGIVCVRELFRFLISLCNPLDSQNTSSMVNLGLCLVETALEVGADHLAKYPSFLQLVKDPLCRNLLSLLSSERVSLFALDLQVSFLLFESLRTHLKLQLESFFTKLVEIIMSDNAKNSYEAKEITHLALESIAQMWRIPGLCTELYLNYDCDIYCSNLFEDITKLLSKTIVTAGIHNYHTLALDALFTIIDSIEANCHQIKSNEKTSSSNEAYNINDDTANGQIAIDMCDSSDNGDESIVHDISQYINSAKMGRHKPNTNLPTESQLENIKNRKRWIATGTEHFNQKPEKGVEFLQEHGILSTPLNPLEIAHFLRNNPGLDKKMIGEYISKKKNVESRILATYAASFDMAGLRVDQALRLYLETFRLPGEAPLIFLVMEHFADHWHECNGNPFANTDAAFRLAYAIIMLNMDQHNHNAKKLNIPMTVEDFVRNLRGCNGSNDFDQKMLEATFHSIKNEEIVMPAERSGIVKENYLWKVLLRRGATKEGLYVHSPSGAFDKQLFTLTWGPLVAALSSIFEKSSEPPLYSRALEGFDKCASIVAHYSLTSELDTVVLSLCKFTGLLSLPENVHYISIGTSLGQSAKSRCALKKVFSVCHRHANSLREGWKHILEVVLALFRGHLLPKDLTEADDFCSVTGKISLLREAAIPTRAPEASLLSSLYSYIASSSDTGPAWQRQPSPEESVLLQQAGDAVAQCNVHGILVVDSKFLQLDSLQELIKYVIAAGKPQEIQRSVGQNYREDPTIFFLELLIQIVIQNRDRVTHVWQATEAHVTGLMKSAAVTPQPGGFDRSASMSLEKLNGSGSGPASGQLERSATGLLRLAICLMRSEECASVVLRSLKAFLDLTYPVYHSISSRIAVGLFELVKTSAQNIHSADDWAIVFTLLETTGAGAAHLKEDDSVAGSKSDGAMSSEDDSVSTDRGYTSDSEICQSPQTQGWILVGKNSETNQINPPPHMLEDPLIHACRLRPHDPRALLKCWECLAFIVRDVAHITPYNFEACVNCIRTFVEASLHGTNEEKVMSPSHVQSRRRKQASHARRAQRQQQSSYGNRPSDGSDDSEAENAPDGYQLISIQLLDLMHTLHSRTAQIFKWWREESNLTSYPSKQGVLESRMEWRDLWPLAWQPLLQGIARLCTDNRKQVANNAVTYLQRALLVHDLQTLSGEEWESAFHTVLFPLLARPQGRHQEVRLRANTIMCKVFLHHLTPLVSRPTFSALWLQLLDLLRSMLQGGPHSSDLLHEATLESLKNMLLVMDSVKVFDNGDGYSELWAMTWERINTFLPNLKDELFPKDNSRNQLSKAPQDKEPAQHTTNNDTTLPISALPPPTSLPPCVSHSSDFLKIQQHTSSAQTIPASANSPSSPTAASGNLAAANTAKGSSIILQPPVIGSHVHTPIFSHLGQMSSTPIGVAVPVSSQNTGSPYPILCPNPLPQKYYNSQLTQDTLRSNSQLLNMASQQNRNNSGNPSPFTLISPQQNTLLDSNLTNVENANILSSNLLSSSDKVGMQADIFSAEYTNSPASINIEVQQPRSLYGEYLTNPYNPLPDVPLPCITCEEPTISQQDYSNLSNSDALSKNENSQLRGLASNLDKNYNPTGNVGSGTNVIHKSQSVTCSPSHTISHANTFGSSDNIKNMTQTQNPDSGVFSFSKYFYTDSTNIPPGSEILFGDNFMPMNEG